MSSQRRQIREAFRSVLIAAETSCGDHIEENRVRPFRHKQLPAVSLFTQSESVAVNSEGPRLYVRECEVIVNLVVDGERDVDDEADRICDELEAAIEGPDLVSMVAELARVELIRVEGPYLDRDGSKVLGGVRLVYLATYEDEITEEAGDIVDFQRVHTEVDTSASNPGPELEDELELPTNET